MTNDDMDKATAGLTTKSAKIRALDTFGVTRAEIAKYLNIRYQHVRNVLVQPTPTRQHDSVAGAIPSAAVTTDVKGIPLTIEEAKLGLAAHFGVQPSSIEITIRG